MKREHSTIYTQYNSIEWIWKHYPKSTLLDQIHVFHDRSNPLKIAALEEPLFFGPAKFTKEELFNGWGGTQVDILLSHFIVTDNDLKHIQEKDSFVHLSPTRHFFPLFFLYYTYANSVHFGENPHPASYNPFFTWTYYCRAPRPHRYIFLNEASKSEILHRNIYSYGNTPGTLGTKTKLENDLNYKCDSFDFIDTKYKHDEYSGGTPYSDNKADFSFLHSALQIAAETTHEVNFFTEKTFLPLLIGKPVIVHGAHKANRALELLGFKLHTNIIDYSFDSIEDLVIRTKMLVEQLKMVQERYTPREIFEKCKEVSDYNKNHALTILRQEEGIPDIFYKWVNDTEENKLDLSIIFSWWYKYKERLNLL